VAVLLLASGALQAQEEVRLTLPPGFVPAPRPEETVGTMRGYLPADQQIESWTDLLTVQRFENLAGMDPEEFFRRIERVVMQACPDAEFGPIDLVRGGPYRSARMMVVCPSRPPEGGMETFMQRVFSGREAFHVVQYHWKRQPSEEEIAASLAVLSEAVVCDPGRAETPCPDGGVLP
jgi:hypothetical protein